MTTPTERAAEVIDTYFAGTSFWTQGLTIAEALDDEHLLAAPVDGELREALETEMERHAYYSGLGCPCGNVTVTQQTYQHHLTHALLPTIVAHVAERERKLRKEIAAEIMRDGFDPSRYTLIHPVGSNTLRVMQLVRDDCAQIARGEVR